MLRLENGKVSDGLLSLNPLGKREAVTTIAFHITPSIFLLHSVGLVLAGGCVFYTGSEGGLAHQHLLINH